MLPQLDKPDNQRSDSDNDQPDNIRVVSLEYWKALRQTEYTKMDAFIADGAHIPFFALKNYLDLVGTERAIVVTDAMAGAHAAGMASPKLKPRTPASRRVVCVV